MLNQIVWIRMLLVSLIVLSIAFPVAIYPVAIFTVYAIVMEVLTVWKSETVNIPDSGIDLDLERLINQIDLNSQNIDSAADAELAYLERLETVEEKVDIFMVKENLKELYS